MKANEQTVSDLAKLRRDMRQSALHHLEAGDVQNAITAMRDTLETDRLLAGARLDVFNNRVTPGDRNGHVVELTR